MRERIFTLILAALFIVGVLLVGTPALSQRTGKAVFPRGFVIEDDETLVFGCTGGSCAQAGEILTTVSGATSNPGKGTYRVTSTVETVWLCTDGAAACAKSGTGYSEGPGIEFQPGVVEIITLNGGAAYARSAGGAGLIRLAPVSLGN